MKPFDYSKVKDHATYHLLMPLNILLFNKTMFRVTFVGKENVPKEGGFILASNHIHFLDPLVIAGSKTRVMYFMAKEELFHNPAAAYFMTRFNAFPVKRGSSDKASVEYAIRVVKEGNVLGIFPEGTRSPDYRPGAPKAGVALIAKQAHADVLPVSIYSEHQAKYWTDLTVRFGKMIPYQELGITEEGGTRELREASRLIMDRITELWEEGPCRK